MRSFHGVSAVLLAFVATVSLGAGYARAATYTVTNTNDDLNPGSLRWAVTQANSSPGSTVNFKLSFPAAISPHPRESADFGKHRHRRSRRLQALHQWKRLSDLFRFQPN